MIQFPDNFFWGSATSAYQVEGDNLNCDWRQWEQEAGYEAAGRACRHYELYRQDFDLARQLNHNAHRLSVEWSRIEPQEGVFSSPQLKHYRDVILSLRQCCIEPIITLHHFTNPLWFAKLGGWANKNADKYFSRYVEKVVEAFCDQVTYWVTINEPMVYIYQGYIWCRWPPGEKSYLAARKVTRNMIIAHCRAYRTIHAVYEKRKLSGPAVSIAQNLQAFVPCSPNFKNRLAVNLRNKFFNFEFIKKAKGANTLDFIGINYYSRSLVDVERWGLDNLTRDVCNKNHHPLKKNSLGWDIYPEGLYDLLMKLKRYNLPIFILENGICTQDDGLRWDFIYQHLKNIHLAISQGADILGYIYWSLLDNFEWDKGFAPRFGLIDVDFHTFARTI